MASRIEAAARAFVASLPQVDNPGFKPEMQALIDAVKEPETDRDKTIREWALEQYGMGEDIDVDDDAAVSEGDDNGAFVQAWVWVSFVDTDFNKDTGQ